ncbi:hypothetical protein SY85_01890 [Flavisolibacter tropicus]|uniref:Uncharacterized protein n=1 Tax=Flavisolibacter tropicus TaxID=1492898 RepID=A0A172TR17_9BACT|nr:hypothetical protein SY85_01890 [Flavisolibacter tropicus]
MVTQRSIGIEYWHKGIREPSVFLQWLKQYQIFLSIFIAFKQAIIEWVWYNGFMKLFIHKQMNKP